MTDFSTSPGASFDTAWPSQVRKAVTGEKSFMKKTSSPAVERASLSLNFLATLLGSISPAKNTTPVVMSVLMETALSPQRRVTPRVTRAAVETCTMLVPTRIALMAWSKWSRT